MYLVASIRPTVRQSMLSMLNSKEQQSPIPVEGVSLCVCNQWACTDNRADAVNRLLLIDSEAGR